MTTILDFRPEVAAAVADGSLDVGLSDAAVAALRGIYERNLLLIEPITHVNTLEQAESLVVKAIAQYVGLIEEWGQTLREHGVDPVQFGLTHYDKSQLDKGLSALSKSDRELWEPVLQSEAEFLAWNSRHLAQPRDSDEFQRNDELVGEALGSFLAYLMAKNGLIIVLNEPDKSSPQTVAVLTQLADNCMTEVEDVFLAHADYGEDDGQRVSLDEVRANLGL